MIWLVSIGHTGYIISKDGYGNPNNFLITDPVEVNGIFYGTFDNPVCTINRTDNNAITRTTYSVNNNGNIVNVVGTDSLLYTNVVGSNVISNYIETNAYHVLGDGKFISGKWRIKNILSHIESISQRYSYRYLFPILNTIIFSNGNSISSFKAGNKALWAVHNPTIAFGDISITSEEINGVYYVNNEFENLIVDFGSIPQEVPPCFYDFIELNFDYIYPNTYTIKSPTGETLAQVVEQPPIKKTNLQYAGNAYQLSLTGTNDVVQTLSWSYETPEDMTFVGLSNRPNGPILIGLGESEVSIENSVDLYPVFRPYKIPSETFDINLFKNTAEYNRVDKTNYITDVGTISGVMREASSITDLTITIERADLPNFNYVYIEKFGRYYFVNDIRIVRNELFEIDMTVDVLMSYKDAIKSLRAFVDRNENTQNPMLIDKKKVIEQGVDIEDNYISNQVGFVSGVTESNADNAVCFVLTGYKISSENVEQ